MNRDSQRDGMPAGGRPDFDFDVIVVGGGTGNNVAKAAAEAGLEAALVEPGPLGGTCLNRGCNPSKMLLQRANVVETVRDAERFGVEATVEAVDVPGFVGEIESTLSGIAAEMERRYREMDGLTLFDEETRFLDERTLELGGEAVTGEKVVVAAGSRPAVPPIDGLAEVEYLTSDEALYLREHPDSMVLLGGGYVAVELGYFFEAMGTDVTIVEVMDTLVPREDPDVAAAFTEVARERHDVYTGFRVTDVSAVDSESEGGDAVSAADDGGAVAADDSVPAGGDAVEVRARSEDGETVTVRADELLVATGRRPNSDRLDVAAGGIETDDRGFVETDEYLRTTAENVWAQGDIAGNFMFKHSGDFETRHTVANVVHGERRAVDYTAMPHAIFAEPQIAGVGATEDELAGADREYVVGRADFADSAMGRAKKLRRGFVKVLAAPDGEILGCHVFGREASTLIHEAVVTMRTGDGHVSDVAEAVHAHPTLSRVVEAAFRDVPVRGS